ncbi:interferon-gamma-inducible GTPase 10-like [Scyliorhinus torazame]
MMMFFYDIFISFKNCIIYYFRNGEAANPQRARKSSLRKSQPPPLKRYINVAVTGPVDSGKSTLVNAMRGVEDEDEAPVDSLGGSSKALPRSYSYPANPRVLLWDLPGIETHEMKQHAYLEKVDLRSYDFFILTTSSRMEEEVLYLAKEILRMDKSFYFVRTKIDIYMRSTKQPNFTQGDLLREIRKYFSKKLQSIGVNIPRIFLLSALQVDKFDFENFIETFNSQF